MRTLLLFLFLSVSASAQTITYLKVADKPEYAKYLVYCQTPAPRTFYMQGAVTVLKVNDLYADSLGNWRTKYPLTIKWFPVNSKSIIIEPYQHLVTAKFEIMVPKRYPTSIDDFYKNWKTGNIQCGLVDPKTIPLYDYSR